jgi:hypothetical protein
VNQRLAEKHVPKAIVLAYYYRDKFRILPGSPTLLHLLQLETGDGAADLLTAPSFAAGARLGSKQ